ncbi:hypothetical protein [Nocardia mexicana]|uniref:Uncharacterized protein n=1 Tax=Nocardia mexicana TaxID=279262 RepID=A0A370GGK1_9NOCA|nr:hypothetical protein [Nocardia mexicana]RDI42797.1 hypothetical protein DFR68_12460 [Nocardia mexicana]
MTASTPRAELERELGGELPGIERLSAQHCADLLNLVRTAPARERAAAHAEFDEKLAARTRPTRALLRALVLGRRR